MADEAIFTFDLGADLGEMAVAAEQADLTQPIAIRCGDQVTPGRIVDVTTRQGRVLVAIAIECGAEIAQELGAPVPQAGAGIVGEAPGGERGDDV